MQVQSQQTTNTFNINMEISLAWLVMFQPVLQFFTESAVYTATRIIHSEKCRVNVSDSSWKQCP